MTFLKYIYTSNRGPWGSAGINYKKIKLTVVLPQVNLKRGRSFLFIIIIQKQEMNSKYSIYPAFTSALLASIVYYDYKTIKKQLNRMSG